MKLKLKKHIILILLSACLTGCSTFFIRSNEDQYLGHIYPGVAADIEYLSDFEGEDGKLRDDPVSKCFTAPAIILFFLDLGFDTIFLPFDLAKLCFNSEDDKTIIDSSEAPAPKQPIPNN